MQWCNFHSNRSTFEKVIAKIQSGPDFMNHGVYYDRSNVISVAGISIYYYHVHLLVAGFSSLLVSTGTVDRNSSNRNTQPC